MKKIYSTLLLSFLLTPFLVLGTGGGVEVTEPQDVVDIIVNIRNWLWTIFIVAATISFLVAAFYFITAGGDPARVQKGKDMIMYGIIGIFVAFVGMGIVGIIESIISP